MKNFFFINLIKNTVREGLSADIHKIPKIVFAAGETND